MSNLEELRTEWEAGRTPIIRLASHDMQVVVTEHEDGFTVLRYFAIFEKWNVSIDLRDGGLGDAFSSIAEIVAAHPDLKEIS